MKISKRSAMYQMSCNYLFDLKYFIDQAIAKGEMFKSLNKDSDVVIRIPFKKGVAKLILPHDFNYLLYE